MDKKMEISFVGKRDNNDYYSGWEINDLTGKLNSIYYKNQILFDLNKYVDDGVSLKNIICFTKTLNTGNSYKKYTNGYLSLEDEADIQKMYFLGIPVTYEPNKKIELLKDIFEILRTTYTVFNRNKVDYRPLNREQGIKQLFRILREDRVENSSISQLVKEKLNKLQDLHNPSLVDINKVDNPEDKAKVTQYINDKQSFFSSKNLQKLLKKLDTDYQKNEYTDKEIENQHKNFINLFNKNARPIISIYDDSKNSIKILGIEMFVRQLFSKENTEFLETNKIGQNSPLIIIVSLSVVFLGSIVSAIQEKKEVQRQKLRELNIERNKLGEEKNTVLDNRIQKCEETIEKLQTELVNTNDSYHKFFPKANDVQDDLAINNPNLIEMKNAVTKKYLELDKEVKLNSIEPKKNVN
ncbi:hypothetical protein [Weissella paramesenteroides]|uniref:hypothetical protein n=1 Tax=Weissella paramesenteroides TaxID=1249 RepID=UPI00376F3C14